MRLDWTVEPLVLGEPLRISRATMSRRDAVCVRLSQQGADGFGEVVTSERLGLDVLGIDRRLQEIKQRLQRYVDPGRLRAALPDLLADLAEAPAVVAAVDAAVHDLLAMLAGIRVHQLLGAPRWRAVPTAHTIGIIAPAAAAAAARTLAGAGFRVLKVKLGSPDPVADLTRVRAVREAAPQVRLLLDPNGAWDTATAVDVLTALEPAGIEAVEQPIPAGTPEDLAQIARKTGLPVIADEDAATLADVRSLPPGIAGVNIKLAECGGLHAARQLAAAAQAAGMEVMLGCLVASSLGVAPAAHLSGLARWVDLDGHLLLAHDPWTGIGGEDGMLRCPRRSGLGVIRRRR